MGPEFVLFEEAYYCSSPKHTDDPKKDAKPEVNDIESYIKNIKYKTKNAIATTYEKMKKK